MCLDTPFLQGSDLYLYFASRRTNYFVLNEVESFILLYLCFYEPRGYLFKVTEAEQEEGNQPRHDAEVSS